MGKRRAAASDRLEQRIDVNRSSAHAAAGADVEVFQMGWSTQEEMKEWLLR
jgi:hypothetical protein